VDVSQCGLLVALAVLGVGIMLALIAVSFVTQGEMAQATIDLGTGYRSSLSMAW
jgi:hypothetical protein